MNGLKERALKKRELKSGKWRQPWKARGVVLGLVFSVGFSLCGCGASKNDSALSLSGENGAYYSAETTSQTAGGMSYDAAPAAEAYEGADADFKADGGAESENMDSMIADTDRKLIRNVNLSVETKEFDALMTAVTEQVKALGGYIENSNTYNGSSYSGHRNSKNSSLTIRIPKDKLDGFLETVSGISNVVRRSENVNDVTLAYVDLESHKNALKVEQERLIVLLEKAETVEDILTIENRLSDVRYQLESMESRLRTIDNQVDYSTVYLDISEVKELTPVEEKNAWQRMGEGFVDSLESVGDGFKEFCIWIVVHIPYLVIAAAVIFAIVMFMKWLIKRAKKKKEKKTAESE
ncbi:MAG: DUF4349 domain-containing protein [Bacteroidales bacterium]|nr:DUF4349 domain-containing protein [Lachnoclostridium sp.]MCM1383538.1 DUF4349 domain-containing protein [Lachnoclostridium sp.]MCM1464179.1 DUF4349 domain-containing protein [Bacteroidales bacterium]